MGQGILQTLSLVKLPALLAAVPLLQPLSSWYGYPYRTEPNREDSSCTTPQAGP